MSSIVVDRITERAKNVDGRIVLPEAEDERVLRAAEKIVAENFADILLLGRADEINTRAKDLGVDLSSEKITIIDHRQDEQRQTYIDQLVAKREKKGMTPEAAEELLAQPVYYGGFLVADGRADGMVAGSICPTADTVRASLYSVGLADGNKTVSSCSLMVTIAESLGVDGALIFADTGVVPEPTVEQLADIGIAAAAACKSLLDTEPHVAMLSFSTKGSAHSPAVQKVIDATQIVQRRRPDIKVDGELQLDAAVIPDIAERKCPNSPVAGKANTLVFPDLSCGNIAYKLVERLGNAAALGPLLLGLAKPINDLSRGCSVEDIVLISAITVVQSL
jgi:phosphate acetyltransferase